jgi:hypothetical protein
MYAPGQLFIWRIDALKKIIDNPTEENLFEAARFLRQILLDGANSLLFQVNRNLRLKIYFIIVGLTARPNPNHPAASGATFSQISIAPDPHFPMIPQKRLDLDNFLKQEVIFHKGQTATVREVIKYVANKAGAVHKQKLDTPEEQSLEDAPLAFRLLDTPSVLYALDGITKVVVTACDPLYQKLRA